MSVVFYKIVSSYLNTAYSSTYVEHMDFIIDWMLQTICCHLDYRIVMPKIIFVTPESGKILAMEINKALGELRYITTRDCT